MSKLVVPGQAPPTDLGINIQVNGLNIIVTIDANKALSHSTVFSADSAQLLVDNLEKAIQHVRPAVGIHDAAIISLGSNDI